VPCATTTSVSGVGRFRIGNNISNEKKNLKNIKLIKLIAIRVFEGKKNCSKQEKIFVLLFLSLT
jgi:hypothetical protein